jgi:hypothetical protein
MAITTNAGALRGTYAVEAGGAATESMGGIAAIVLTILALVGVLPRVLTSIAGIVFGVAFMVEGAAIAARQTNLLNQAAGTRAGDLELGGGVTIELMGGLATLVLGILSLIGIAPGIMLAALTTTGGAALILSAGVVQRLNELQASLVNPEASASVRSVTRMAVFSAASGQFLAGVAVIVLGILGLVRVGNPVILSAVGILVLGAAITLSGTALASRLLQLFRRG